MECYGLDPAHYYTPGMAWDAMLKMTGITLELLTDIDKYLFFEQSIRGGIAMISNKYLKANNKYLPDYDPTNQSSYIPYLDANNLYGWAMSEYLPSGDFEWLTPEQIENLDIVSVPDDSDVGYMFEVDLTYPSHLHKKHSDYPLAPDNVLITKDRLSPHTLQLREKLNLKGAPCKKLVPNLRIKEKYILHYRNLEFYLS